MPAVMTLTGDVAKLAISPPLIYQYAGPERQERKIFVFGTVTYEQCCAA
jgi:hypothetical protein